MILILFNKEIKIDQIMLCHQILNFKEIWLNFLLQMILLKLIGQLKIVLIHLDRINHKQIIKINMHLKDIHNNNNEIIKMINNFNKIWPNFSLLMILL